MWSRLGGLTDAVKDGFSEFKDNALKEIGGVSPVAGAVTEAVKSGADVARSLTAKARRRESSSELSPPGGPPLGASGLTRWVVDGGSSTKGDRSLRKREEDEKEEDEKEEEEEEEDKKSATRDEEGQEEEEEEEGTEGLADPIRFLFNLGLGGDNDNDEEDEAKADNQLPGWEGRWQEQHDGDNNEKASSLRREPDEAVGVLGRDSEPKEEERGMTLMSWERMPAAEERWAGKAEEETAMVDGMEVVPVSQSVVEADNVASRLAALDSPAQCMENPTSTLVTSGGHSPTVSMDVPSEHLQPEDGSPEQRGPGENRGLSISLPPGGQRDTADDSESGPSESVLARPSYRGGEEAVTTSPPPVDTTEGQSTANITQEESRERSAEEGRQAAAELGPDRVQLSSATGKEKVLGMQLDSPKQDTQSGSREKTDARPVGKEPVEDEAEKWRRECEMLKKLLVKAAEDRGKLAVQLASMEDKLEHRSTMVTKLELELQLASSTAQKQREVLEQKVKAMASTLEKRMEALTEQISNRDGEITDLRQENEEMGRAYKSLRTMLEESVSEREKLAEELNEQQRLFQDAKDVQARLDLEVESARREAADSGVELADLKAELWAVREAAKGRALGEDERQSLEQALKAVSASASTAAGEAASWQSKAQTLEKELQLQAKVLAGTQAELALVRQQVLNAEAAKEEAQKLKDAAEGATERLQEESEIRTRRFNAAVKTAVSKIQAELEAERDAAFQRIAVLEAEAASQSKSLEDAMQRLKDQTARLEKMNEEAALMSMEKEKLAEELGGLQAHFDETEISKREALEQADGAREAAHAFSLKMAELEAKYFEAQTALEASVNEGLQKESLLKEELEETKVSLASVEREKNALKSTVLEGSSKAAEELATLRAKVAELEGKLGVSESRLARMAVETANVRGGDGGSSNRSRGFISGRSQTKNALESLGLDAVREERLLWKSSKGQAGDIEGGTEPLLDHHRMRRLTKRGTSASSDGEGKESSVMDWIMRGRSKELFGFDEMRGTVSRRSAILIIYIMVLHIMVMVSFTHKSPGCGDGPSNLDAKLPGF